MGKEGGSGGEGRRAVAEGCSSRTLVVMDPSGVVLSRTWVRRGEWRGGAEGR